MRSAEYGGVSIKAVSAGIVRGPSLGGVRGSLDALNATVPIGRVRAPSNEGPVSLKHINLGWQPENTPRVSKDVTEPIKVPKVQSLRPRNLPAESFLMLVVARSILPTIAEINLPLSPAIKPASDLESVLLSKAEDRLVFSQPSPHAPVDVAHHHDEEEEIEEKLETRLVSKRMQKKVEEDKLEEKENWIIDEEAQAQRRFDLKTAARSAKELAVKLGLKIIPSEFIAKFMPSENSTNRSKAVEPEGPDGTYEPIILPTIAKYGEFESQEQAETVGEKILEDNNPVKNGQEEGRRATNDEVKKVLSGRGIQLGALEFITRVVKIRRVRKQATFMEAKPQEEPSAVKTNPDLKKVFKLAA